ncbi:T9SS type A sorting domain-containing protein, partial [Nonlabens tegetincola]
LITDHSEITELSIHPNPVHNFLYIDTLKSFTDFLIIDTMGRTIKTGTTKNSIDVSKITSGIYFLNIGGQTFRVIKS